MAKDRNDFQTTIRMPSSMWEEIERESEKYGLTCMEWIRRACREKLDDVTDPLETRIKALEEQVEAMRLYIEATKND